MSKRAWQYWLAVAAVAAAVYPSMSRVGQEILLDATGLVGIVTIVAACVRGRLPGRAGWLAIAAGLVGFVAGDVLWGYYDLVLETDPFPSLADALYLAGYPLLALGLWLLMRSHGVAGDRGNLIDAGIVSIGGGVVTWVFLVVPLASDPSLGVAGRVIAATYPVADLLLLSLLVRLFLTTGGRSTAFRLLGSGLGVLLVADVAYAVHELTGAALLSISNIGFLVCYALTASAILHPSVRTPALPLPPAASTLTHRRLAVLSLAALLLPGVVAYQTMTGLHVDGLVLAMASAALILLVVLRLSGLVRTVEQQAAELSALARVDALTGTGNRRRWDEQLPAQLAHASRAGIPMSVAILDIDQFKAFNDEFGHPAGDELLRVTAAAWQAALRSSDLLVRYGGEEFAVLLSGCSLADASELLERLRASVPFDQTCSAGIAQWDRAETARDLVARADAALYRAKAAGRNCTEVATSQAEALSGARR